MSERAFELANAEATAALADLASGLTPDDLAADLGGGWTVSMAFAHLAFWDTWHAARWRHAAEEGWLCPPAVSGDVSNRNNDALEATWAVVPGEAAVGLCLDAAAAMDIIAASLTDEQVAGALANDSANWVERAPHRLQHVEQIRAALDRT
jgi:hypothetical protein